MSDVALALGAVALTVALVAMARARALAWRATALEAEVGRLRGELAAVRQRSIVDHGDTMGRICRPIVSESGGLTYRGGPPGVRDGSKAVGDGSKAVPDGSQAVPDGSQAVPDGSQAVPDGSKAVPDGSQAVPGGSQAVPDGSQAVPDGSQAVPDGSQAVPDGSPPAPADLAAETEGLGGSAGPRRRPVEPPQGVEAVLGLTWATRVGGALLLAGVFFFFKYAIDRAWLGPWARVGLGAGAGVLALAVAARLRGRASAAWVDILAGVGLALLLIATWAAHALYGLFPASAAFVISAALVTVGGALAVAFHSEPLLVTALAAGLAAPVLLGDPGGVALRFAWTDVLAVAALLVATPRDWRLAAAAVALGGLAVAVAWWLVAPFPLPDADRVTALIGALALSAILAVSALRWRAAPAHIALFAAAAALAQVALAALLPAGADAALVAGDLLVILGLAVARRQRPTGAAPLVALVAATATLAAREPALDPSVVALVVLLVAAYLADAARATVATVAAVEPALWTLALAGPAQASWVLPALAADAHDLLAAAAVAMTATYAVAAAWLHAHARPLGAAVAAQVALAWLATVAPLVLDGPAVPVTWAALAAVTAALAARTRLPHLALGAAAVLALAAVHVAVLDLHAATDARAAFIASDGAAGAFWPAPLVGALTVTLAALGAALLVLAAATRRGADVGPLRHLGVIARFAGWAALGLTLVVEARLAVDRSVVTGPLVTAADAGVVEALLAAAAPLRGFVTTLAMGGWAGAVLALGFARRDVHARWFGLGLLAAVVLKLVAVDLWDFDPLGRTVTLVAFGVLLLASGFLYARFGGRLRGILRDGRGDDDGDDGSDGGARG